MASQRRSSGRQRASRQGSTQLTSRSGRTAYYRQGGTRTVKAGRYQGGRTAGGYYTIATPGGQQVAAKLPARSYHRFILVEFTACIAMIGAALILLPAQGAEQGAAPAARSFARELVQLTALCLVFFVLALMASGQKTGKVAAAFGGLVTLGVAWNVSGIFAALAKAVTGTGSSGTGQAVPGIVSGTAGIASPGQLGVGQYPTPDTAPLPLPPLTGGA